MKYHNFFNLEQFDIQDCTTLKAVAIGLEVVALKMETSH